MEKELKISYPTVRAKLDGVIKKLGYETPTGGDAEKREEILKALEKGELTVEEAIEKIEMIQKEWFYG